MCAKMILPAAALLLASAASHIVPPIPPCLTSSLALPRRAYTSAGVYRLRDDTLVKTLWSRRALSGSLTIPWSGEDDAGALVAECVGGSSEAAAAEAYEVRVLSSNVSYVWEGAVGNTGVWQVGPWVLRALYAIADLDIAGGVGAYAFGYCERQRALAVFNTSAPNDLSFVSREDYHWAPHFVATDGEVLYAANAG